MWIIFNHIRRNDMFPFMSGFGMAVSYVPQAWFSVLANSEGCYVPNWLAVEWRRAGQKQSRKAQIKGLSPGETRNLFTQTLGKLGAVHSNYPCTISHMYLHQCIYFNNLMQFSVRLDIDAPDQESFSSSPKRLLVLWSALLFWLTMRTLIEPLSGKLLKRTHSNYREHSQKTRWGVAVTVKPLHNNNNARNSAF